jgi:gamma-glutamyl-gamma-aminobutyraldehyde dehydrogenase/4-guanidinobutyraldehyde dehydrogenase/NAD-dependent aldehyde dehydrogenase
LECGGKSPNVVFADAPDLEAAAQAAAAGIFLNQGAMCNAGSRLLVERSIRSAFLERVCAIAADWRPADPLAPDTQMGAIIDQVQFERIMHYVENGRHSGAALTLGGERVREDTGGYYLEPTIFGSVPPDSPLARDEIFGPVLSVLEFDGLEEAVRIAGKTVYGLAAGVWSRDIDKAFAFARHVQAGTIYVNGYNGDDITVPFGGFRESGFGRDKSLHALAKYSDLKTIWIQHSLLR